MYTNKKILGWFRRYCRPSGRSTGQFVNILEQFDFKLPSESSLHDSSVNELNKSVVRRGQQKAAKGEINRE